jgi:hypothetical protein
MSSSILSGKFLQGFLESYPAAVAVFEPDGTMYSSINAVVTSPINQRRS